MVELYKLMMFICVFDVKLIVLQCIGKFGIYVSCLGYEVVYVGIGLVMKFEDVLVFSYCEYGVQLYCGVCLCEVYMYWGGDECGNDYQNELVCYDFVWSVLIVMQCLYVVGSVLVFKICGEKWVVVCIIGDGGLFKGDFYGVINIIGVQNLLMVVVIVNNQWVILVLCKIQLGVLILVQKGIVVGLYLIQVDGNDIIVVCKVMEDVLECVCNGEGGSVIEVVIYCFGDYIIVDDVCCYCGEQEVKDGWVKELMKCLKNWLVVKGVWDDVKEEVWKVECDEWMDNEVNVYFEIKMQLVLVMFDYIFVEVFVDFVKQCDYVFVFEIMLIKGY